MSELGALAAAWWAWIAPLSVQAAVFAALVLLLDRLLQRRGWPRLLHALWLLAALRFVLPPTLASPLSLGAWIGYGGGPALAGSAGATGAAATPATAFSPTWLFGLWLVGATVVALRSLRGRRLARLAVQGEPAPPALQRLAEDCARRLGLRRVPGLVVAELPTACVQGLLRPVVAVPAHAAREDLESLLLHELAHVRRRDLWCDAALSALCAAFWFHPAAWLTRARLARLRELCCDASVASALGPRAGEYRATLLRAAARLIGEPAPQPAFLGARSQLVLRLRALERAPRPPSVRRSAAGTLATLALGACALPLARPAGDTLAASETASLAAARSLFASALDGTERPGCLRLHFAAMRIAAEPTAPSPLP